MKRLLTAAIALTLLTGTAAMAQPDHRDDRGGQAQGHDGQQGDRGGQQHWAQGQRMPKTYYSDSSRYVDYRSNHLRAPRRGYRWVRTDDNNYAMVAITSGLIASIVAANH